MQFGIFDQNDRGPYQPVVAQFSFGDLSHQEVLQSASIFAREVLPPSLELAVHAV
jgi:hypothetical protein